jgi:HEAT repeat protein
MKQESRETPFQEVLEALLDNSTALNSRYLYRLSDLEGDDLDQLKLRWSQISEKRRLALLGDLETLQEKDYVLSYEAISCLALSDTNPSIRFRATRILRESESLDLIPTFLTFCTDDPDSEVRACTTSALGRYVYLGETDELPREVLNQIEERLLQIARGKDESIIRRRALESLGYSSRKEIPQLIIDAYHLGNPQWLTSALIAMGRSADPEWSSIILDQFAHPSPMVRAEAARASGEIELEEAVAGLVELLEDGDDDVRDAAIWSLSQIGGEGVFEILESLLESTEDEDLVELIEEALDNLVFTEGRSIFNLLGNDDKGDDELLLEDEAEANDD